MRALAVAAILAFALPGTAGAQNDQQDWVTRRLQAHMFYHHEDYATAAHAPTHGAASSGGGNAYPVQLTAGVSYVVLVECDRNCRDVDLRLIDSEKTEVAKETDSATADTYDNAAEFTVTPTSSGLHSIQVSVNMCAVGTCQYVVAAYRQ